MEELIKKAKEGDREAATAIIEKYKKYVFKKANYYHVPGYDYEDLVQHGYLSIIKAIHMYKLGSNSYNGYFMNAIKMNFAALLKGEINHYREIPDENILNKDEEYNFTIEDEVIAYEEVKELYEALDKLELKEREILERRYIKEESFTEIAADMNFKYDRTTYLRNRALKNTKSILNRK
ncbi:sigma-70 family RNA polymerase sigma factor [Clostridium bovifaecis]|uniref:Sigma-70 family RNA polymerase sigma factor n=1 Tax=Clostridium bovifaecis TaxID=2184719 RepID=A0A6I6FG75_9CLOT|nr:sigma-70 family RNA polymerase sigma factor [Clostridium bovifaecis]